MSDTKRGGKPSGYDFGAKYNCDKGYCAGVGKAPKKLANKERRADAKALIKRLSDAEIEEIGCDYSDFGGDIADWIGFARAIEDKLLGTDDGNNT